MKQTIKNWQAKGYNVVLKKLQSDGTQNPEEAQVRSAIQKFFADADVFLPKSDLQYLADLITFQIVGLGPLEFYLRDPDVSEIMVNGPTQIYIEKAGRLQLTTDQFTDDDQVIQVINRIVSQIGRRIDESQPLVDGRLPDGSRINAIIPPLALNGPTLTIRKFPTKAFTIEDMVNYQTIDQATADFMKRAVESGKNILVSGGTGAGKTSTLNAFASLIPKNERIITIEDAAEIRIDHPHLITLESRAANIEGKGSIPIRSLLKNALRMRPDRIVVGEIRGEEAIDMLQAMNTGHQGSLTTLHANAPLEALMRLETMVLMGGVELPLSAIRPQIIQAIDLVCQQERGADGRRRISQISEVQKGQGFDEYKLKTIFTHKG